MTIISQKLAMVNCQIFALTLIFHLKLGSVLLPVSVLLTQSHRIIHTVLLKIFSATKYLQGNVKGIKPKIYYGSRKQYWLKLSLSILLPYVSTICNAYYFLNFIIIINIYLLIIYKTKLFFSCCSWNIFACSLFT